MENLISILANLLHEKTKYKEANNIVKDITFKATVDFKEIQKLKAPINKSHFQTDRVDAEANKKKMFTG